MLLKMRGKSPEETAMDLVIEDGSRVGTVYFLMSEANVKREVGLPWMSFGSDEGSPAPEGVFLKSNSHPRAYGNVARLLGHYVRDEHAATLEDAVRRLTSLPATNLGIRERGALKPGYYGDIVIFDLNTPHSGLTNISRDRFRMTMDIRVTEASGPIPTIGSLVRLTESQVTVTDARTGTARTYTVTPDTYVRSIDGKKREGSDIPTTFKPGEQVIVNALDGRNATLVRSIH